MSASSPPVQPLPGWKPIRALRLEGGRGSWVSGDPSGDRLRVAYFEDPDGDLVGRAWFGPGALGPPGHAHGGSMASVLDEAMGAVVWMKDRPAVAVHLAIDFRRMLPLGTDAHLEARITGAEGRKVFTEGSLHDGRGTTFCAARGVFLHLDPDRDRELVVEAARSLGMSPEDLLERFRS